MTATIGLAMLAYYNNSIGYVYAEAAIETKEFVLKEITLQDYTVEGEIGDDIFEQFKVQNRQN